MAGGGGFSLWDFLANGPPSAYLCTPAKCRNFLEIVLSKSNWSTDSRHKRGYGSAWDRLRLVVLKRDNGLCQCNECQGGNIRLSPANEVHHIIPKAKGGTNDLKNLQAVNNECHRRLTAREQGSTLKPKRVISESGWPIEQ